MKDKVQVSYLLSNTNKHAMLLTNSICEYHANLNQSMPKVTLANAKHAGLLRRLGFGAIRYTANDTLDTLIRLRKYHRHDIRIRVVLMDEDEELNLKKAVQIGKILTMDDRIELFVLASTPESECLLDTLADELSEKATNTIIRRVLPIRNTVYSYLYNNSIFDDFVQIIDEKWISLVIIGLNQYSLEMLKAVLWCGQMEGYFLRVDVFDQDPRVQEIFYAQCPGIAKRGTRPRFGEDYYDINFHPDIRVETNQLFDALDKLNLPSWICIDAGNDVINIQLAMAARAYFSRRQLAMGKLVSHEKQARQHPRIQAIVQSDERALLIEDNALHNFKKQHYQVECLGKDSALFSHESIFAEAFEKLALSAHLKWGESSQFNRFEYYRRSSLATMIFKKYRDLMMPDPEMRAMVEHKRWNAYMRSTEGYQYGPWRDDLAKVHPSLLAYDNLTKLDQQKDWAISEIDDYNSQPSES